jgi:membrane-associated protease RseP (regulator of RpoE activity)
MNDEVRSPVQAAAERVEKAVADLFAVQSVTLGIQGQPETLRLHGRLQVPSDQSYPQISARLREMGYTAALRHDADLDLDELLVVPGVLPQVEHPRLLVHALLLGATILTTLYVGAGMVEARPPDDLWWPFFHFWKGWPFALSLLSILLAHELGHYFTGRHYRVPVSLPYFIPLPVPDFLGNVLGTLGAVIRMKAPITNRRVMLDIGAAGPLVGLAVAIPILVLGLSLSEVQPFPVDQAYSMEGNSLLYLLVKYAIFGRWLPSNGVDVFIHPVAFAGWAGLLVTSLNLIPAGQLDGGHVLYSLLADRARLVTWPIILALGALGLFLWPGWFLWAGLVFLFGQGHPGPLDSITQLDARRKIIAVAVLVVFVLTFTPIPLTFVLPGETGGIEAMRGITILAGVLTGLTWLGRRLVRGRLRG